MIFAKTNLPAKLLQNQSTPFFFTSRLNNIYSIVSPILLTQTRQLQSKSTRNKSTRLIGKHKEPRTKEEHQRRLNKHKPFVLGRDNVKRGDFEPIRVSDEMLNGITRDSVRYNVMRTSNGALPVYTDYRNGRSRIMTIIRRLEGDLEGLSRDLKKLLPTDSKVEVKSPQNHIVIKGNYQRPIRYWLNAIGF